MEHILDELAAELNSCIEHFNRTWREDVPDAYLFDNLQRLCDIAETWMGEYNTFRPHDALGGLTSKLFVQQRSESPPSTGTIKG